jgi:hypothetical protein
MPFAEPAGGGAGLIRLRVVKDDYGWSIRIGEHMTSPFRRREVAIREANRLAADIRGRGGQAEAIVEDAAAIEQSGSRAATASSSSRYSGSGIAR